MILLVPQFCLRIPVNHQPEGDHVGQQVRASVAQKRQRYARYGHHADVHADIWKTWNSVIAITPTTISMPNSSLALDAIYIVRNISAKYSTISSKAPTNPMASAVVANIKSVCFAAI